MPKDVAVNRNGYYWTGDGKPFHSAGEVPAGYKVITRLRFGSPKSKEKALRLDKNGNILSMSLTAARRMSEAPAQIFESLFWRKFCWHCPCIQKRPSLLDKR